MTEAQRYNKQNSSDYLPAPVPPLPRREQQLALLPPPLQHQIPIPRIHSKRNCLRQSQRNCLGCHTDVLPAADETEINLSVMLINK